LTILERSGKKPLDSDEMDFSQRRESMEEAIKTLEARRAQSAPKWWSEWLA